MIGLDTGFFVALLGGHPEAVRVWKDLVEGEDSVTSCLTLYELRALAMRGKITLVGAEAVLEAIPAVSRVLWLDHGDTLAQAARLTHGLGLPAMDALILADLLEAGATVVYSTDVHMETGHRKGVKVVNLKNR
ncbi:MAG: type II toxin-antitoxin system VapC family toxin [Acidobacteria bacterium]|nr:type II toxin-antitoxin system VapC family toxin [Acidobacteriota bacterium]